LKSSFSELSYAFALTENLVHFAGTPLLSAPTFPSTAAEGKKGAGHDLKLSYPGMNLFLQFKLSHCMSYGSAKEFTSGKFPQKLGGKNAAVYRMYLHPLSKSRQTSLMLKLEKRHELVYYVAPLFHLPADLSKHYFDRKVAEQSRFLRPSAIKKMPDQLEHFVSFRKSGKPWRFSDEPLELAKMETQEDVRRTISQALKQQRPTREALRASLEAMLGTIEDDLEERRVVTQAERSEIARLRELDRPLLSTAEFVARTYFDAQLLTFVRDDSAEDDHGLS
jgi:hypothetical protein